MKAAPRTAWRWCAREWVSSVLSGNGGLATAGRWNEKGVRIVYASTTPELAVLEALVHIEPGNVPPSLVLVPIEIDSRVVIEEMDPRTLPKNWSDTPAPASVQRIGRAWIDSSRSAILSVPSAIVTMSRNLLINPHHRDIRRLRALAPIPFPGDPRLLP